MYNPELVILVPTRGRPSSAMRLQTALDESDLARVVFIVDEDDGLRPEYESLGVDVLIAPPGGRPGIVDPLNWAVTHILELLNPPYVGFLGDDHLPQGDWDKACIKALEQTGPQIVYGNDLLMGEKLPTAVFMTSDIPRTLGYMVPPELRHLYADNYWLDLGRGAECLTYVPDAIIEHLHFTVGKSQIDATYETANTPNISLDRSAYRFFVEGGRLARDVAKLREMQ